MDATSVHAARVLGAVATANERLRELRQKESERPQVTLARQDLELRDFESGPVLMGYVDAELKNGNALAWLLDVHWGESGWTINSELAINDEQGYERIKTFPERSTASMDKFIALLHATIGDLCSSVDAVDFDSGRLRDFTVSHH